MGPNTVEAERNPAMASHDLRHMVAMGRPRLAEAETMRYMPVGLAQRQVATHSGVLALGRRRPARQLGKRRWYEFIQAKTDARCEAPWQILALDRAVWHDVEP